METLAKVAGLFVGGVLIFLGMATLFGFLVWCLWPTVVTLFHAPEITLWQAIKLSWLCSLLFKSSSASSK